jgi:nitroreductase
MTDETLGAIASDEQFFDIVGTMRAMRRLKPDPVPLPLLRKVLETGVQAPSGQNTQPWSFVVIRKSEAKHWFATRYKHALETRFGDIDAGLNTNRSPTSSMARQMRALRFQMDNMQNFPVLLLVCGKRDWPFKVAAEDRVGLAPPNYGAVYPCVQNILLACRALGLGAALTTMHQVFEDELHAHFEIPTDYGVVVTIPIGFPMGNFGPVRRKPASEVTYFDRWGNANAGSTPETNME